MTEFEKVVKIIADEYKSDCDELDCTIAELFKCWQIDNEEIKADFWSILNEKYDGDFTDDCEIITENKVFSFKQLVKAVKNYQF